MRLRPENLFYKKERCIDAFFQKKKDEKKKETFWIKKKESSLSIRPPWIQNEGQNNTLPVKKKRS